MEQATFYTLNEAIDFFMQTTSAPVRPGELRAFLSGDECRRRMSTETALQLATKHGLISIDGARDKGPDVAINDIHLPIVGAEVDHQINRDR